MDKVEKLLLKLSEKERKVLREFLSKILNKQFLDLDIKKLKGREDVFRARKGNFRVIFRVDKEESIFILTLERRSDTTYSF